MISDRIGRRAVLVTGLCVFALVYVGLDAARGPLFALYGRYVALTDGTGRALIAERTRADRRATVLGVYGTVTGVAMLLASIAAGMLWEMVGPAGPFALGAAGALVSAVLVYVARRPRAIPVPYAVPVAHVEARAA